MITVLTRGSQEPISLTWNLMQLNGSDDIYVIWKYHHVPQIKLPHDVNFH